jgi:anti-sigma factor RsiW
MNPQTITEADLHAYVDGKLPAGRRAEVDAYLAQRPDEQVRLRAYSAQNLELRQLAWLRRKRAHGNGGAWSPVSRSR